MRLLGLCEAGRIVSGYHGLSLPFPSLRYCCGHVRPPSNCEHPSSYHIVRCSHLGTRRRREGLASKDGQKANRAESGWAGLKTKRHEPQGARTEGGGGGLLSSLSPDPFKPWGPGPAPPSPPPQPRRPCRPPPTPGRHRNPRSRAGPRGILGPSVPTPPSALRPHRRPPP